MHDRKRLRAYVVAVRRNKTVVAILFAGLMLFGGILATFHALWARNHSVAGSIREDALWATYQIDREAAKFDETLHDALRHPDTTPLGEVSLRFDILYSRHEVMEDADFPAKFRNDAGLKASTGEVATILHRMTPVFDRIAANQPIAPNDLAGLADEARGLRSATEKLLAGTHHLAVGQQAEDRAETSRIYAMLGGAIAAMTLALGTVIVMIWRQLRQLEQTRFRLQRLSEELVQSVASAEAGNRAKSAFLATMSHEIRTPLNGIVGMAELLASTPLDAGQRDRLGTLRQCSDGLVTLIDDILDFSKLESGKIDLERRPMDLGEVVDGVVDMFAPKADSKGIEMVASHPGGTWVTDPTRFRQILVNLVGNAVKFTDRGTVAIRIFETRRGGDGVGLRVLVEDTGVGISEENQKRLFREFTQADASINRRFGGTGLGLAISRRIVRALGGEVKVESREGHGATFRFEIPVERIPDDEASVVGAGLDVRVVARAPLVASVVERALSQLGFNVHHALAGADHRRVTLYDVEAFAHATLGGAVDRGGDVVVFGHGARAFAGEATDVVDGPMTPRRLARLLAHRVAGTHYGGSPSAFVGDAIDDSVMGEGLVLLVEDNPVNQTVAKGLLARLGFTVEVVGDGARAVERVAAGGVDAVLMDMQMPVMDGLEATRRIRAAEGEGKRVPIVGLTANAFASDREACLSAGMDDFVTKPVTRPKLARALARFVRGTAPGAAATTPREDDVSAQADEAAGEIVDRAHRAGLADALGPEGLAELTTVFRDDAARLIEEIATAVETGDRDGARKGLHTLKGAAANVGLVGIVATIDAIRAAGGLDGAEAAGRLAAAVLAGERALACADLEAAAASPRVARRA
ncbi:MAG: response regulator [Phyllobacteriaceae bacterium]|nr:response regulator [Phyllobacteriaceae bacterium]